MEHNGRFNMQCGEGNLNEFHKLQLFHLLLPRTTFTWYSSLSHQTPFRTWQTWKGVSITYFIGLILKLQMDESAVDFIESLGKRQVNFQFNILI